MTDQNLVKGDPVYPQYLKVTRYPIEGNASPVSFVKGEYATIDSSGFLSKLTTSKIGGLVQVMNAVTGGLAGDDTVLGRVMQTGSRTLVSLPTGAKPGDLLEINGSNGTGNFVVSVALVDTANVAAGRLFELYRNEALTATAGDLGVMDMGAF